ncbi:MAG: DinB family protein [Gemmatimonadota bacterium]|nr:DinB family protein [Gemmatimonadota bacterium]
MKSISNPAGLAQLIERLNALRPDTPRQWGTLSPGEMLCHLGDATASVLRSAAGEPGRRRPFMKWIALRSPLVWPHGLKTPPRVDPQADGTKPGAFDADRERAVNGLRAVAAAPASALTASHGAFGRMTAQDWHRWAYRHTDHHLRQFGL